MSLPPKSEDEISAPDDGAKPAKRGRPRARKAAAEPEAAPREEKAEIFVPERRPEPEPVPEQHAPPPQEHSQQDGASGSNRRCRLQIDEGESATYEPRVEFLGARRAAGVRIGSLGRRGRERVIEVS